MKSERGRVGQRVEKSEKSDREREREEKRIINFNHMIRKSQLFSRYFHKTAKKSAMEKSHAFMP